MSIVSGDVGSYVSPGYNPTRTVADLVQQTQRHLYGTGKRVVNRLDGDLAANAGTLTVLYNAGGMIEGSNLAIDDEILHVWTVSGKVATVQRGWLGSTAAQHSDGAIVEVNPRFSRFAIKESLKEEILSWGPEIFGVGQVTISALPSVRGYDLAGVTQFRHVLDVTRDAFYSDTSNSLPRVSWVPKTSAEFASGYGIVLASFPATSVDLFVTYARGYDVEVFEDNTLLVTIGLAEEQFDIPAYGAAWRLMSVDESNRSDAYAEGLSKSDERVPPGYRLQTGAQFKRMRDERLAAEQSRLRWKYPLRVTGV